MWTKFSRWPVRLRFHEDGVFQNYSALRSGGLRETGLPYSGVGTLYVRRIPRVRVSPQMSGGGQERGIRSGTLPTPLVVGLGAACRLSSEEMEVS